MNEAIHIYHTNDLHSHFEHWPKIQAFLKERKRWHEEAGDICLILDIGDHADRSHPYTEATAGKGNVELMNEAGYDAVTIGNNEGITLSKEELDDLYVQADFDVILGNLFTKSGERPEWAKPHQILTMKNGLRIGLVGATAEFTPFYDRLGWSVRDGKQAIMEAVSQIRPVADLVICLSHLGIKEDEWLAEQCQDIDVLLGAHTHHAFHTGKQIGRTLLGAAGKFGTYIGHIEIHDLNMPGRAELIETAELPETDEAFDVKLMRQGRELLSDPVFRNRQRLKAEWFTDSRLAEAFSSAILDFTGADCAMFNAGIFMEDLPEGAVTRFDFHRMLPHPINLCLVELNGAELKEIYLQSLNEEWPEIRLKGLGFRGAVVGKMIHAGLELKKRNLYINGEPADPDRTYRLITLDLFTFGHFFPSLKRAKKTYYMPEFLRDVFEYYYRGSV